MNYKMIGRFVGKILLVEAIFMLPALFISIYKGEDDSVFGFVCSIIVTTLLGLSLVLGCKNAKKVFYAKEGMVCVAVSWFLISFAGAFPFYLSGEIPMFVDALFETVSGFTTTGASILPEVESLSMGLIYWRSFTHWLGGMGVLVFVLAIANGDKSRGGFAMHLLRAESPGPKVGKLVPKMKNTAEILYGMYIILTLLDFIFLLLGGMPVFDSLCTAFGTAGTGGFGIKNDSMAGYSPYLQNVCTVFMLLFGVNFSCYYFIFIGNVKDIFKDEELRLYLGLVTCSILLITSDIYKLYDGVGEALRHAAFQVSSIITTTGFATTDFDLWPSFSKMILMLLMIVGACAGSTGGGFKCGRALLIFKNLKRNIKHSLHSKSVEVIRVNNQVIEEKVLETTNAYLAAYVFIILASIILISLDNFSVTTNITAVLATFNNIGPGFDAVGPTCNFAGFGVISKLVLILDMLAGRLEIFTIMVLFLRSTWRYK